MNRNASESAVDRLIAMAEDEKPDDSTPAGALPESVSGLHAVPMLPDPMRGVDDNPMFNALLQLRMMAPYMSRLMGPEGQESTMATISAELKQSVGELQLAQRDLRMTVQEQLVQMKRLEEEMHRTREATDRYAFEATDLVEDMKSVHSLLKKSAMIMGGMLLVLLGLVIYLLVHNSGLSH